MCCRTGRSPPPHGVISKKEELAIPGQLEMDENVHWTGASAGPAPVPRLVWQPETLGNAEVRKDLV